MALLELEHVSRRYGRGTHVAEALRDVSLTVEEGELVAVWGRRRSGRSTLVRVAAGLEPPDSGAVRFEGRDLRDGTETVRQQIAFCRRSFRATEGRSVLDQLVRGSLARGVPPSLARSGAREALERVGATKAGSYGPSELDGAEAVRVAIARTLTRRPHSVEKGT